MHTQQGASLESLCCRAPRTQISASSRLSARIRLNFIETFRHAPRPLAFNHLLQIDHIVLLNEDISLKILLSVVITRGQWLLLTGILLMNNIWLKLIGHYIL